MGLFNKGKENAEQTAEELPKSGCGSMTEDMYHRIYDELFMDVECDTPEEKFFYYGFLAGLGFVTCPSGEEMHGKDALEFAQNAYLGAFQDEVEKTMAVNLAEAATNVLKLFGISGDVRVMSEEEAREPAENGGE